MKMKSKKAIYWMRRDLRLEDNHALAQATEFFDEVYPVFIFDEKILTKLKDKSDPRISIIYRQLLEISKIKKIHILFGDPVDVIPKVAKLVDACEVFANEDYESYAIERDRKISKKLKLNLYKDTVVLRFDEIVNGKDLPYKVFTAYKNKWLSILDSNFKLIGEHKVNLKKIKPSSELAELEIKKISDIGFKVNDLAPEKASLKGLDSYDQARDFPALNATSKVSVPLRFGFISIRSLVRKIYPTDTNGKKIWLSELIWREFYFSILGNFPHIEKKSYKPEFENIEWIKDEKLFKSWCEGKTGVPIVDAGMRELNTTGFMHNRVRMIVASYLCKTLLIDWRKGEKYFAEKLLDFDLAANNGGWQWCASTGCDSTPYFRIFNPYTQGKKFDSECVYIKKYVEELRDINSKDIHSADKKQISSMYNKPIVNYSTQRIKAFSLFKKAKEKYLC
jgi:deoxyribodipyrimidine photo-lyase